MDVVHLDFTSAVPQGLCFLLKHPSNLLWTSGNKNPQVEEIALAIFLLDRGLVDCHSSISDGTSEGAVQINLICQGNQGQQKLQIHSVKLKALTQGSCLRNWLVSHHL